MGIVFESIRKRIMKRYAACRKYNDRAGVMRLNASGTAGETSPWYPWAPIVYLASGTCILLLSFFLRPAESSLAIASVLVGVPVYAYFERKGNA